MKYKKIRNLLQKRFTEIAEKDGVSKIRYWRLVILDIILNWIEKDK